MHRVPISKLEVDSRGTLWLTPGPSQFTSDYFERIYRAAMSACWDGNRVCIRPESELTIVEQVAQIARAAQDELGVEFVRTASTEFVNLGPEVTAAVDAVFGRSG